MRIINLASGSKGNSTLIEHGQVRLLIDAGLGISDMQQRLQRAGVQVSELTAIVLSHNHIDHIKSAAKISNKYNVPVYAPIECYEDANLKCVEKTNRNIIEKQLKFGEVEIFAFDVSHDALHTIGFNILCDGNKVSMVTDIGIMTDEILESLKYSNLVMIESNYDTKMLYEGPYPFTLKRRISSNRGHLSNTDCAETIVKLSKYGTKHFMLMHMSETNNTPDIAYNTIMNRLYKEYGINMDQTILLSKQHDLSANIVFKTRKKGEDCD